MTVKNTLRLNKCEIMKYFIANKSGMKYKKTFRVCSMFLPRFIIQIHYDIEN